MQIYSACYFGGKEFLYTFADIFDKNIMLGKKAWRLLESVEHENLQSIYN